MTGSRRLHTGANDTIGTYVLPSERRYMRYVVIVIYTGIAAELCASDCCNDLFGTSSFELNHEFHVSLNNNLIRRVGDRVGVRINRTLV